MQTGRVFIKLVKICSRKSNNKALARRIREVCCSLLVTVADGWILWKLGLSIQRSQQLNSRRLRQDWPQHISLS